MTASPTHERARKFMPGSISADRAPGWTIPDLELPSSDRGSL
jgi:hypothetical protein